MDEAVTLRAEALFSASDRAEGIPEREREQARKHGKTLDRHWHLRKDGSVFWADGMLMRLDHANGTLRGFAKVARDATEQKRAEEALQASEEAVRRANAELEQRVRDRTSALAERTLALMERTEELSQMSAMRQELLRQLVSAQEKERALISRDLHDDTGQHMTALLLGLSHLKGLPPVGEDAEALSAIARLERHADEVAKKAHQLSYTLRPTALDDIGLMGALQNYTEEWSHWSGIAVDLQSVGLEPALDVGEGLRTERLPPEIETTVYRITQEALTNILRHAVTTVADGQRRASRVDIVVQRSEQKVTAIIEDDGPGFDVGKQQILPPGKRRLGIFGMEERARLAGGTLTVESEPGRGTVVYLRLPVLQG